MNNEKLQLLTGVVAMFVLPNVSGMQRALVDMLGINSKSNYVAPGVENRKCYEYFLELTGDLVADEMVVCCDGFGKLISASEESVTSCLNPWKYDRVYAPSFDSNGNAIGSAVDRAWMARWEPSLDEYNREERSDTAPVEWKTAIESFHQSHNHTSPDTRDMAKRTHPKHRSKMEVAPKIFRYEPWDQLWSKFQKVEPGIANLIRNPEAKAECPTILRTYAPWEMVKGTNSSCLCLNCEGMNACRCGSKSTVKAIEEVKKNVGKILPSAGGEEATSNNAVVDGANTTLLCLSLRLLTRYPPPQSTPHQLSPPPSHPQLLTPPPPFLL